MKKVFLTIKTFHNKKASRFLERQIFAGGVTRIRTVDLFDVNEAL